MKCIILAGGSGDRLWPLSRKDYPKQFIEIREHRSLLQEAVARNIPFCDEFIIITNKSYQFIIEEQMEIFQGLSFRIILEKEGRHTGPAVALAALMCNLSEYLFIITADHFIENGNYRNTVIAAKQLASQGNIALVGMPIGQAHPGYGYIQYKGNEVISFIEKPTTLEAEGFMAAQNYLWNSGLFIFRCGDLVNWLKRLDKDFLSDCLRIMKDVVIRGNLIYLPTKSSTILPYISIEELLFEKVNDLKVVTADFEWTDIRDLESLETHIHPSDTDNILKKGCRDVTVINHSDHQLVVLNQLSDMMVVNTNDALYLSKKGSAFNIKKIISENNKSYASYFQHSTIRYRPWGTYEQLYTGSSYAIKKVTVTPGKALAFHKHELRYEHWSIISGAALITIGEEEYEYTTGGQASAVPGQIHRIANPGTESLVIIETSVGTSLREDDTISMAVSTDMELSRPIIVRLNPAFKDYLWGGTKLRDIYQKPCDYETIAESWELSAHPAGQSIIADGPFSGMYFGDYVRRIGSAALGWKCQAYEKFPLLIKFIDARQSLSIQVHPDDDFALETENEYGKNEMWYILDCEDGASLYCGVKKRVTCNELLKHIEDNTVASILNEVRVKKGDVIFVEAGTIHAIGKGITICEIQQSSNATYRLYDYGRRDKFGNTRELHLDKALQVATLSPSEHIVEPVAPKVNYETYDEQLLCRCKYFEAVRYDIHTCLALARDESSFLSVIILEGNGVINTDGVSFNFKMGDSFFLPARRGTALLEGECSIIVTHV